MHDSGNEMDTSFSQSEESEGEEVADKVIVYNRTVSAIDFSFLELHNFSWP